MIVEVVLSLAILVASRQVPSAGLRRIGTSVSVMGKRDFVVFAAISAFYNKVLDLFVSHGLKKSPATRSAIVIRGSAALDGGSNEGGC